MWDHNSKADVAVGKQNQITSVKILPNVIIGLGMHDHKQKQYWKELTSNLSTLRKYLHQTNTCMFMLLQIMEELIFKLQISKPKK